MIGGEGGVDNTIDMRIAQIYIKNIKQLKNSY